MKLIQRLIISLLAQCKGCCFLVSRTENGIKVASSCAKLRFQCKLVKSLSNMESRIKGFQSEHVQIPLSLRRCISVPKIPFLMKMPFFSPFVSIHNKDSTTDSTNRNRISPGGGVELGQEPR